MLCRRSVRLQTGRSSPASYATINRAPSFGGLIGARKARRQPAWARYRRKAEKRSRYRKYHRSSWSSTRKYLGFATERFPARSLVRHNKHKCAVSKAYVSVQNDDTTAHCETTLSSSRPAPTLCRLEKHRTLKSSRDNLFTTGSVPVRRLFLSSSLPGDLTPRLSFSKRDGLPNEQLLLT